jgi:hypothetical protein
MLRFNRPTDTMKSALLVHDFDITVLTVAIGESIDRNELGVVASAPECQHMFFPKDFDEVDALKDAIEQKTCDGKKKIRLNFFLKFLSFHSSSHFPGPQRGRQQHSQHPRRRKPTLQNQDSR